MSASLSRGSECKLCSNSCTDAVGVFDDVGDAVVASRDRVYVESYLLLLITIVCDVGVVSIDVLSIYCG